MISLWESITLSEDYEKASIGKEVTTCAPHAVEGAFPSPTAGRWGSGRGPPGQGPALGFTEKRNIVGDCVVLSGGR